MALLLCGCMMVTACGITPDMPELSEEDTELVTEYAAGLMLKYDTKYSQKLLDDEALAEEEAREAEQRAKELAYKQSAEEYLAKQENAKKKTEANKSESDSSSDSSGSGASAQAQIDNIGSFYGLDAFDVAYTGYELCASYPSSGEDMFMAMEATEGNQLLVLKFNVANTSSEDSNFDMFYRSPSFNLSIDGGAGIHQQATLLLDDMAAYNGTIAAGSSEPMVLVYEVDGSISQVGGMVLTVKSDQGKGQMTLQ